MMVPAISFVTCRLCLQQSDIMISVFEYEGGQRYSEKLRLCADIESYEEDGLPDTICKTCSEQLPVSYDFIMKCRETDQYLRKLLLQYQSKDDSDHFLYDIKEEIKEEDALSDPDANDDLLDDPLDEDERDNPPVSKKKRKNSFDFQLIKKKKAPKKRPGSGPVVCGECGLTTVCQSAMVLHKRTHSRERPFKCSDCDRSFNAKGLLKRHAFAYHTMRERTYVCEKCGKGFYTKPDYNVHMRIHTGEKPYACCFCSETFKQHATLIRHKRTHTGAKPFPCGVCGKCFADRSMVKKHLLVHTDERKHHCELCNSALKSMGALKTHMAMHTNEKCNICDYCGTAFSSKGYLKRHITAVHSVNAGHCIDCDKYFSDLTTHRRKHTGEKPFSCTKCHCSFISKRSLLHHERYKHVNADKFKCTISGCGKTFAVGYFFEVHKLKYHLKKSPYVCEVCERGFCRISDLNRHLKLNHGVERKSYSNVIKILSL